MDQKKNLNQTIRQKNRIVIVVVLLNIITITKLIVIVLLNTITITKYYYYY
jgi:hypothetical protein